MVYLFGGRICHQIAERSFFLDGAQMPVCARCLGIYAGAAVALLLSRPEGLAPAPLQKPAYIRGAILLVLLMNLVTLGGVPNTARAGVGAALGVAVAFAIRHALRRSPTHEARAEHGQSADTIDYEKCALPRRPRPVLPESHI